MIFTALGKLAHCVSENDPSASLYGCKQPWALELDQDGSVPIPAPLSPSVKPTVPSLFWVTLTDTLAKLQMKKALLLHEQGLPEELARM